MNNSMIIGQYVPGHSLIHRLDPRTKILIIFFFVITVFFANSVWSYAILTAFAVGTALATRVPLSFVAKGLKPVWFLIIFTFLLHLFVSRQGDILFTVLGFPFYEESLIQGSTLSLRFFLLILFTSLLTLTTSPIEITDAIEYLLHPLKRVKFPVHELALMMSISLRFIPTLMQEAEKISKARRFPGCRFPYRIDQRPDECHHPFTDPSVRQCVQTRRRTGNGDGSERISGRGRKNEDTGAGLSQKRLLRLRVLRFGYSSYDSNKDVTRDGTSEMYCRI